MSLVIEEKYRVPFYLDTNILVDYLDGTYPSLNQSLEYLSKCPFTELRSSHYVEYELVEVRKLILFYRKATTQNGKYTNKLTSSEKSKIKQCWMCNGHDYNEFKREIEEQVITELSKLKNELAVNFDDHVLHDRLLSPTYKLVLKSKFSREDSLVLTSCMLPDEQTEIDFCVILTRDKQFYKTYSNLKSDAKTVLNEVCHTIPKMTHIELISTLGNRVVNLCKCVNNNISEIWPQIILELIKAKNINDFAGITYKHGNKGPAAKCVYFKSLREDGILQNSEGLCFITSDLSKTIIKSVGEKDFYMNDGVFISSLPSTLENGNKVSFMPKSGEENDLELIRKKGCYVFYYNE